MNAHYWMVALGRTLARIEKTRPRRARRAQRIEERREKLRRDVARAKARMERGIANGSFSTALAAGKLTARECGLLGVYNPRQCPGWRAWKAGHGEGWSELLPPRHGGRRGRKHREDLWWE